MAPLLRWRPPVKDFVGPGLSEVPRKSCLRSRFQIREVCVLLVSLFTSQANIKEARWKGEGCPATVPTGGGEYHFYNLSISNPVD